MRACVIRRPNSNEFTEYEGNSCSELFKISKYYILEYICYHIQLIPYDDDQGYETNDIALAQNFPGVYYTMTLNDHWLSGLNLFKIMSIERREGTKSMASAPVMSRGLRNGSALNTYFYVSHTKMVYQRLPPPFDTMCVDYRAQGMSSSASCLNNCMLKWTLQHLDRYWYGSRSNDPVDKRPLSPADFQSATFNATFQGISDRCKKACYQLECDLTWTLTSVQSDRIYNSITFQVVGAQAAIFYLHMRSPTDH
ncbi:hypothetical protein HDE_01919 [Halotydeus destructor]|nr:hypothetical protein HDE_01919 [Halotydeus destructor]